MTLTLAPAVSFTVLETGKCLLDKEDFNLVKDMVEQAFTMVNLVSAGVNSDPMDKDAIWLLKQLFNVDEGSAAKAIVNRKLCYICL